MSGNRALEVGFDHAQQRPQHGRGGGIGALVGEQRHVDLRGDPARHAAGGSDRLVDERLVGGA